MSAIPTEADFVAEAQAFLDAHAPRRVAESARYGEGPDDVALFKERTRDEEMAELDTAREWRRKMFDAGFGWITGPEAYGGRGLPGRYQAAYDGVAARYATPSLSPFAIGLGMVAPTILAHGTDLVKDAYLRKMYRGDVVGCQLFSEPGAGSDLASVSARAERDGDEWVVSGQKVWTSGAQYSDIGEVICRTDPSLPKHKGLSMFVVDMQAPGVEVRPLRQMTGGASFNEVFFEEVRIPDSHRLGDVNQGWTVALTTLMNERASIGGGGGGGLGSTARLIEMARHFGADRDPVLREELARIISAAKVSSWTSGRAMARIKAGQLPGPEMSIAKLALTLNMTAISDWVSKVLGPRLVADSGEWGTFAWSQYVCGTPGMRIAGGSDEVMRNIVGERVLGLPKEPPPK